MRQLLIIIFLIGIFIQKTENQILHTEYFEDWEDYGEKIQILMNMI